AFTLICPICVFPLVLLVYGQPSCYPAASIIRSQSFLYRFIWVEVRILWKAGRRQERLHECCRSCLRPAVLSKGDSCFHMRASNLSREGRSDAPATQRPSRRSTSACKPNQTQIALLSLPP